MQICSCLVKPVSDSTCKNLSATLVRHQFYTKIDWELCEEHPKSLVEREFRAVIRKLISGDAPELSKADKQELEESLISDALKYGPAIMAEYSRALNPPSSAWGKLISWLVSPLQSFLAQQNRKHVLRELRSNRAG